MDTDDDTSDIRHILLTYWPDVFESSSSDVSVIKLISKPESLHKRWQICLPPTTTSYILKQLTHGQNLEYELNYLADFHKYLDTSSLQVPHPIALSSSQALFIEYNHHFYWLYEYINGNIQKVDFDEQQMLALATCLSKYHHFLITHNPPLHTKENSHRVARLLDELRTSMAMIRLKKQQQQQQQQQSETTEIDIVEEYVFDCYPQLSKIIKDILKKKGATATAIKAYPIHGDIRPTNVIWDDNKNIIGLLDFENVDENECYTLWRDLAICSLTFCCSDDDQSQSNINKIQILINEYLKLVFIGLPIPWLTKNEFANSILDEMIMCSIEDYLFLYWQYKNNESENFQGLDEMKLYYKRSIWHYENISKFY
ncbi:unnamed protein product [Didymodactylos carnosus]|uniref:Aminoglycoside phosphotransferase domain-containing protein n=1 Tax=Didymodactylos carnosus TaxID=1234261 RepID=A0A815USZ4_9BILA|nr:unnamed protein product [Didymodactylos carnosus]CAF1524959.1 unnamed protein product [Didymodactylos carnosus]CAF3869475.1 unnamed protein product [Didymodactylos carnosus]CAF4383878.1 unnamed protein product [Didymodactylos carnosus]